MIILDTNVLSELMKPKKSEAAIATLNVSDFQGCGIEIINPWKYESI